jgi:hypothetical protein
MVPFYMQVLLYVKVPDPGVRMIMRGESAENAGKAFAGELTAVKLRGISSHVRVT